mgnify:CR=1 FL=1
MDYLAQPDIADVAQQEHGPDDLAKLYKREIQLVLAAVGAEPAQEVGIEKSFGSGVWRLTLRQFPALTLFSTAAVISSEARNLSWSG